MIFNMVGSGGGSEQDLKDLLGAIPVSLSVSGTWTTQNVSCPVVLTGLTFTATYDDSSTRTIPASDITCTPSSWGATTGNQTVTLSCIVDGIEISTTQTVNIVNTGYSITVSSSDISKGTVTGSTTYQKSNSVQEFALTITPASGYILDYWAVSPDSVAYAQDDKLYVCANGAGNISAVAHFEVAPVITYNITLNATAPDGNGTIVKFSTTAQGVEEYSGSTPNFGDTDSVQIITTATTIYVWCTQGGFLNSIGNPSITTTSGKGICAYSGDTQSGTLTTDGATTNTTIGIIFLTEGSD